MTQSESLTRTHLAYSRPEQPAQSLSTRGSACCPVSWHILVDLDSNFILIPIVSPSGTKRAAALFLSGGEAQLSLLLHTSSGHTPLTQEG